MQRIAWRLFVAVLMPFPIAALLIYLGHEKGSNSPYRWLTIPEVAWDGYVALAICLLPGTILIATLPFRAWVRILLGIIYIPVVLLALFMFGILFCGLVFHEYF
jgi:hypothetical protein